MPTTATWFGETPGSRPGQLEVAALIGVTSSGDLPPLYAASRTVADDLVLVERTGGHWRVSAISLSAPTFFTAREVLGKSLAQIHGPVNGFNDRFLVRLVRIFDGLRPGLILQRRNWSVVNSSEPFTPSPLRSAPASARSRPPMWARPCSPGWSARRCAACCRPAECCSPSASG
uniref:DUF3445 domain-containing protein n=1 Tax=Phenylobacterium glaciei TaxID=2803784 RepID=A0A974P4S3_9CAUL|nr:DUF3445 domain-containing protein [Phenylobacterium glaciei]